MLIAAIIKELKLLCRDLHGVAVLFMMPIVFMLIMSAALSSNQDNLNPNAQIVLLSPPDSALNHQLSQALQNENLNVRTAPQSELAAWQTALQQGGIDLLLLNPNRADTPLAEEAPLHLWLNPDTDRGWLLGIKGTLQKHYTEARLAAYFDGNNIELDNNRNRMVRKIQDEVNAELDDKFAQISAYLGRDMWQETYLNRQGSEVARPNSVQHSVPAWLIFGMFFIMIPLSNVMAMERQTNTLTRLNMARAPAASLMAAKMIPYFLINQLQFAGMVALGYWVLPRLDMPAFTLSGSLWPYAALSAAVSLAALGYGLLVSVLARSTEQAVVLGGGGIIIMAALGGIMVPVYVMPATMQQIAEFSPMGWGLAGFQKLLLNHYTLAQIQPWLLRLAGFGLAALAAAVLLYRHQLKTQARF
ncbi:MAG: ABC transporter permease [Eikenella sp.]|nr:ABC transporter permease [Eikenella sp.]